MRNCLIILAVVFSFTTTVFAQPKNDFVLVKTNAAEGVIVPAEKGKDYFWRSYDNIPTHADKFWTPTKDDVIKAENKLAAYLKDKKPKYSLDLWKKLPEYKRQYVGVIIGEKKMIWINLFHKNYIADTNDKWQREPVKVFDGGDQFFNIMYDLKTESFSDLFINMEA